MGSGGASNFNLIAASLSIVFLAVTGIGISTADAAEKSKIAPPRSGELSPARSLINNGSIKSPGNPGSPDLIHVALAHPLSSATDALAIVPRKVPKRGDEPFGVFTFRAPEGPFWNRWREVEADLRAEALVLALCRAEPGRCPSPAALRFLAIIDLGSALEGRARIGQINRAINLAIRPASDMEQHGVLDLWSGPLATFTTGRGDCEDYAIAKYVALKMAGVADEDLRLMIGHDLAVLKYHAVVAARVDGRWLVLDNNRMALVADEDLLKFNPLFVLDHDGVKGLRTELAARPAPKGEAAN
jgi:predicted transglutaminase-like cysteine proteinase